MIYKIEFETVSPLGRGSMFYNGDNPICKPDEVADEYWSVVTNETHNPWQQYKHLQDWEKTGEQLIRNVKLFKAKDISWEPA